MDKKETIEKITAIQRRSHPRQGGVREEGFSCMM
jgi:hypothetical protein